MPITIIILLALLLAVGLLAPRTRTRSLVPVICILLGWYWSFGGFMPTLSAVGAAIHGFLQTLPLRY